MNDHEPHVLFDVTDNVAHITLNRPDKHNALGPEMVVRLAAAWDEVVARPEIRVTIITGAGDRAFCAGADLGRLIPLITRQRPPEDEWDEQLLANPRLSDRAMLRTTSVNVPVIAAARGYALAGGFELLLGSDLRVVADDSHFGLTEVRRGLIPAGGGATRLQRQVSRARAAEIMLVGDHFTAAQALEWGLVNRVVPAADVAATAEQLAVRMAENGPLAMRKVKEVMQRSDGLPLDDGFRVENECAREIVRSEDAQEGPRAFIEKRRPNFVGR